VSCEVAENQRIIVSARNELKDAAIALVQKTLDYRAAVASIAGDEAFIAGAPVYHDSTTSIIQNVFVSLRAFSRDFENVEVAIPVPTSAAAIAAFPGFDA
jgi:hypothetical protein